MALETDIGTLPYILLCRFRPNKTSFFPCRVPTGCVEACGTNHSQLLLLHEITANSSSFTLTVNMNHAFTEVGHPREGTRQSVCYEPQ
jgi:hypothetical protein